MTSHPSSLSIRTHSEPIRPPEPVTIAFITLFTPLAAVFSPDLLSYDPRLAYSTIWNALFRYSFLQHDSQGESRIHRAEPGHPDGSRGPATRLSSRSRRSPEPGTLAEPRLLTRLNFFGQPSAWKSGRESRQAHAPQVMDAKLSGRGFKQYRLAPQKLLNLGPRGVSPAEPMEIP